MNDGVNLLELKDLPAHWRMIIQALMRKPMTYAALLASVGPAEVTWYLDRPVSSSGRLRAHLLERSARRGWSWDAKLVTNPDAVLARISAVAATSDAWILDNCGAWVDLLGELLAAPSAAADGPALALRPDLWLVDLSGGGSTS